ncbi:MAG: TonB-dependent receptor [Pseudomonadota bacterium]
MTTLRTRLTLSASLLALGASTAAAQDLPEDDFLLDPIIVRGELIDRPLQENPTSVTVVTGEQLDRRSDQNLKSVIQEAPNVTLTNGEQGFAIRGVSAGGVGGAGQGQTISIQVDGVALPGSRSVQFGPYSTWDVDQVEILRGPQSTQQGRNALAGAIVIRTNDPTYEREGKIRGELGSYGTYGGAFRFNTPLVEDQLALRITGESTRSDGFVENPTRDEDDFDYRELDTFRAKLKWDPLDNVEVLFGYTRTNNERGEDFVQADAFPGDRINTANDEGFLGVESDSGNLRVNWDISPSLRFVSETSYYDGDYERQQDFDGTAADLGLFRQSGPQQAFEQDLQLFFDTPTVKGVVGLFYADTDVETTGDTTANVCTQAPIDCDFGIGFGPILFQRDNGTRIEITNFAAYGEAEIDAEQWVPGLSFTVGARYDYEELESRFVESVFLFNDAIGVIPPSFLPPGLGGLIPPDSDVQDKTDYSAFLPKIGVTYEWSNLVSTSYTLERGYRSGGQQLNFFTGEFDQFDPEYTWNHEVALRIQSADGRFVANANVYYTFWQDQQVLVEGPSGNILDFTVDNAGESQLYGVELEFAGQVTKAIQLFANLGYAKTEFLDLEVNGEDLEGNRFPDAPEWTGALGGSYRFANGITLAADGVYTGSSFNNVQNSDDRENDSRFIVNASVGYETDRWSAFLYANNLFDDDYVTQVAAGNSARVGDPLNVGAFVTVSF